MILPFLIFWLILFLCRRELGWRGVAIAVAIWTGLLLAVMYADISPYVFVAAQALLDCILIIIVFKGDLSIK